MLGFCIAAPSSDALSKLMAADFPVVQIVTLRFAVQALVLAPVVALTGRSWRMTRLGLGLTAVRSALQVAGIWLMVTGLTFLPLADAVAIAFVMPFVLLLLARLTLGEEVGPRRLAACVVGFGGTLLVMQPSFAEVGWAVLYPLGVAVVFAVFMLVTRRLASEADPVAMQAASGAMGAVPLVALHLAAPVPALAWTPPGDAWPMLIAMAMMGTVAHLMMTWSLRFAPAATLAPMQYLEIPVSAVLGLAVFGDWPDALALAGIGVTVATGLYILWREHRNPTG